MSNDSTQPQLFQPHGRLRHELRASKLNRLVKAQRQAKISAGNSGIRVSETAAGTTVSAVTKRQRIFYPPFHIDVMGDTAFIHPGQLAVTVHCYLFSATSCGGGGYGAAEIFLTIDRYLHGTPFIVVPTVGGDELTEVRQVKGFTGDPHVTWQTFTDTDGNTDFLDTSAKVEFLEDGDWNDPDGSGDGIVTHKFKLGIFDSDLNRVVDQWHGNVVYTHVQCEKASASS